MWMRGLNEQWKQLSIGTFDDQWVGNDTSENRTQDEYQNTSIEKNSARI